MAKKWPTINSVAICFNLNTVARDDRQKRITVHFGGFMFQVRMTENKLAEAITKVDAIAAQAMGEGWSHGELYATQSEYRFPFGPHYGLVCYLGDGQTIGEVTSSHIEVISQRGKVLRIYRRTT
jgi:hypothetical protein